MAIEFQRIRPGVYTLHNAKRSLTVSFYQDGVVRLSSSEEFHNSYSALLQPLPSQEVEFQEKGESVSFSFGTYRLVFNEELFLTLFHKDRLLMQEVSYEKTGEGPYLIENEKYQDLRAFSLLENEHFYGLGDHTGPFDKRNYQLINWNTDYPLAQVETIKSLYKSFPFYLSKKGGDYYGLFLDNPSKTLFDFGDDGTWYFFAVAFGEIDYYLFLNETPAAIISRFKAVTGRAALPARWSLGYQQSRWSYKSEAEVRNLVAAFQSNDIPLSAVHLDIDYMDGYRIFTWNKATFPAPKKLADDLLTQGIHLVSIVDPGIKKEDGYFIYEEAKKGGYLATLNGELCLGHVWPGITVFPTFNEEKTRRWWGEKIHDFVSANHLSGIWCDMNEPASEGGTIAETAVFGETPHHFVHNLYGHYMAKATYEALKATTGKRPFVITRACYVGTCRYSTTWTGDNQSIWDHLRLAIPQQLSLGLCGLSLVGTDIGGFAGDCTPELLARWYELGVFSPLMRNHCAINGRPQEPWAFDKETLAICRRYIKLRYTLIPYLYDLCREEEEEGKPILRPLLYAYPEAEEFANENGEFLFGSSLLAAPIVEAGEHDKIVHFPAGKWYSFFDDRVFEGGGQLLTNVGIGELPLFAKAGAIIPLYPSSYFNLDQEPEELILRVYPGEGDYFHYQDAGDGFGYQKGEYNLYHFHHQDGVMKVEMLHEGYRRYRQITMSYQGKEIPVTVKPR